MTIDSIYFVVFEIAVIFARLTLWRRWDSMNAQVRGNVLSGTLNLKSWKTRYSTTKTRDM